jgi:hypothetical protein
MRPALRFVLPAVLAALAVAAPAQAAIATTASAPMDFGRQPVFSLGAPEPVTFTSDADTLVPVRIVNDPEFIPAADGCSGVRLAAGQSCTVQLRFSPYKRGRRTGTISLVAGSVTSAPVHLKGRGIAPLRGRAGDPGRITCTVRRKTKLGAKLQITCAVRFHFAKASRARASMAVSHAGRTVARSHRTARAGRVRVSVTVGRPGTYRARVRVAGRSVTQVVRVTPAG